MKYTIEELTNSQEFEHYQEFVPVEVHGNLEFKVGVLLFRLQEIADSDLIASNLKSMAKHAIKEFGKVT
jgi:hypothetical protein